ncbi:uncharacterized protein PG986_013329 [Apiospora aurea]|uniref:Uncharacterized protein n=1 Tax=Apiospora aurea TaxID=335848 RepID=A0ABR1PVB0_9PEZI
MFTLLESPSASGSSARITVAITTSPATRLPPDTGTNVTAGVNTVALLNHTLAPIGITIDVAMDSVASKYNTAEALVAKLQQEAESLEQLKIAADGKLLP